MHISRIVIRNYRNLQHFDVSLTPGVTCVVGENNTGKTNLLRAIRLPIDATLSSQYRALLPSDFYAGVDSTTPTQVLVSLELSGYAGKENEEAMVAGWAVADDVARITYRFRPRRPVIDEIESGDRQPENLRIDDYRWEIRGGGGDVDPATVEWNQDIGRSIRFEELQQFLVVVLPPLRDVEHSLRQSRHSPLGKLMTGADIPEAEQAALVDILTTANESIASSSTISRIGGMIDESFAAAAGDAFRMDIGLGMAAPTFNDISRNLTVLLSNRSLQSFDPALNGLGLNNVLYASMLLRFFEERIAAGQTPGQLLLVEEPEAHLHPQLQRVLFATLMERSFQTIATSHSTHITSQVPLESTVVLTDEGEAAPSSCVPSSIPALNERQVADLERYLDATRGTLLFARKVMLVEGPAELFLIPPLVKKVLGVDLEASGISVIPIYGVHFEAYARLFSDDGLRKKCAIIADGDLTPSDATEESDDDPEELPELATSDLTALENRLVKVFQCRTTFEKAVTQRGTVPMFAAAASELGAPVVATRLTRMVESWDEEDTRRRGRRLVLSTAKRFGKARFAQVVSKHVSEATTIAKYIREAVEWLTDDSE